MNASEPKTDVLSLFPEELEELAREGGFPAYRGRQLWDGLYHGARAFEEIGNLPRPFVSWLNENAVLPRPRTERKWESALDGTVKFLFCLSDGKAVEGVLMRYKHGNTLCLSTQVGCRMGCAFCASTKAGLDRSLRPSEMIGQILEAEAETGLKIDNLVLMGMGEPLDNYDSVLRFLKLINHEKGLNIGMRHISLSTCGLVPQMDKLADEKLGLTLSVSLHAPNDALIAGVNDTRSDAREVGRLLKGRLAHLNLIPVNPIREKDFQKSDRDTVKAFAETVETEFHIPVTVRRKLGADIDASCGQLRADRDRLYEQTN